MSSRSVFKNLLVPTDFSDASQEAIERALELVEGDQSLMILLHVIDESLVEMIASHEFAERDEIVRKIRTTANQQLAACKESVDTNVEIETIVSVGKPFLEIIRKADDFAVDAIVMGKVGRRGRFEELLFGSTAEQVLRGSRRPVFVLPSTLHPG